LKELATLVVMSLMISLLLVGCTGGNKAPTVQITSPQDGATVASKAVTFRVRGEDEDLPQGEKLKYSWDFGDGKGKRETTEAEISYIFDDPGTYTVAVIAVDDKGAESEEAKITITVENAPPKAAPAASPQMGEAPLTVEFKANSTDPDGKITQHSWDFGDGDTSTEENPTHRYQDPGTYTVTLTVSDDDGAVAEAALTITVEAARMARLWEVRATVTQDGKYVFEPAVLKVSPGDTVRWVCVEGCPHTATAYFEGLPEGGPSWDSGPMMGGDAFEFTFPADAPEGSYPYFCLQHEGLGQVGIIVVGRYTELSEGFLSSLPPLARAEMEALIEEAKELE